MKSISPLHTVKFCITALLSQHIVIQSTKHNTGSDYLILVLTINNYNYNKWHTIYTTMQIHINVELICKTFTLSRTIAFVAVKTIFDKGMQLR